MVTDPMVSWLRSTLDELERVARELEGDGWRQDPAGDPQRPPFLVIDRREDIAASTFDWWSAEHIARHDPRSVLARVEAEKRLLAMHEPEPVGLTGPEGCTICHRDHTGGLYDGGICDTVRWLAYGHRFDADGFDPAWAPEGVETQ